MGPSDRKRRLEFLLVSMEGGLLLPSEPVHEGDGGVSGGQCPAKAPPTPCAAPAARALVPGPLCARTGSPGVVHVLE